MDSTRRGLSNLATAIAAGLGAVLAVPLAALLAAAFYLRAAAITVSGLAQFLGTSPGRPAPRQNANPGPPPAKPDQPANRLAS